MAVKTTPATYAFVGGKLGGEIGVGEIGVSVGEIGVSAFCREENKLTRICFPPGSRPLPRPARPGPGRSLGGRLGSVCLIALRPCWKGRYIIERDVQAL